ncbi:MAG: type II toxin-antitoxin system RelE/ParE family toxin [Deltaproteobacteria bacterium]|nr:type II toxin-antitoxin system RelE/ParE family toxin [Deltaproteobacteria bacterium]
MFTIKFKESAAKELQKLSQDIQQRIYDFCKVLSEKGIFNMNGIKALKGMKGIYRYRIGKYRVLLHQDSIQKQITVVKVSPRDKAYS